MPEPTVVQSWRCTNFDDLQRAFTEAAEIVYANGQSSGMCRITPIRITLKETLQPQAVNVDVFKWREMKQAEEFDRFYDLVVEVA